MPSVLMVCWNALQTEDSNIAASMTESTSLPASCTHSNENQASGKGPDRIAILSNHSVGQARKTVRLAVAGAFHTDYMKPAEDSLR